MAETIQNTDNLLDLTKITEPFDLASALRYMKENGEFIRCKNVSDDFYISMTDKDLDTFVESAVKQMNDAWKGR
ncbi:TPA: hypothetical protein ACL6PF_001357 [Streptococcus pneumoniae]